MRTLQSVLTLPIQGAPAGPLAGAVIELIARRNEPDSIVKGVAATFETDADGAYTVNVEDGYYTVRITYNGRTWQLGRIAIAPGEPTSLTALLSLNDSPADPTSLALEQLLEDAQTAQEGAEQAAAAGLDYRNTAQGAADTATNKAGEATQAANTAALARDQAVATIPTLRPALSASRALVAADYNNIVPVTATATLTLADVGTDGDATLLQVEAGTLTIAEATGLALEHYQGGLATVGSVTVAEKSSVILLRRSAGLFRIWGDGIGVAP